MFSALRYRTFRRLFAAHVVALLGTGLSTIAIGFLAVDIVGADASAVIGTILGIKMVTFLLVAPIAPAAARRLGPQRLLVLTDMARAAVAVALPFVDSLGLAYVLVFILQATGALFTPTFQATIPAVVPDKREYTGALALSRLAYDLETLLSPSVAGAVLLILPSSALFFGTSAGFVASGLLILSVALPRPAATAETKVRRELLEGIRLMVTRPVLRASLFLQLAVAATGPVVTVLTLPLARTTLGLSESSATILLAVFGAGSVTSAALMPRAIERFGLRRFVLGGCLFLSLPPSLLWCVLLLPASPITIATLIGLLWYLVGIGYSAVVAPMGRLIRENTADEEMPAVFAGQFSLAHGWWIITYSTVGWAATVLGYGTVAAGMTVVSLLALWMAQHLWRSPLKTS